jgi:uncharacterized protein YndB with AHSA1/START domain
MAASNARPSAAVDAAERELVITRLVDAPRDTVYGAWTDPKQAMQWWGPDGFAVVAVEMDVRPGGKWRKCMRSPEGNEFWRTGVYREVVAPERLVFSYVSDDPLGVPGHETLVTVTFEKRGGKTMMTLRHSGFESKPARDSHHGGWTSCIERFARYMTPTA